MATTIRNQVASINACAAHFALKGYHVETTFYTDNVRCDCIVFFDDKDKRERIKRSLCCFADQEDAIEFEEHDVIWRKYYTLTLKKVAVL